MADWETVREMALSFPEVDEETSERPAFRVRGKLFAWAARERDGGGLGVRVDREEKQLILDANPDVYFSSPHYDGVARSSDPTRAHRARTSFESGSRTHG